MESMTGSTDEPLTFKYIFTFKNKEVKEFTINLDRRDLRLIQKEDKPKSPWASLKNFKCPNCPLDESKYEFCPIATNIIELIDYFKEKESIEEIDLSIETQERSYQKHTRLQAGLSSLLGVYMVTTGCPVLERLKPMVRYHLPFLTLEETAYRVVTMYLLAQFFLARKEGNPDWELKKLADIYEDIIAVNSNVCLKLREIIKRDASVNALVKLDCSAFYISQRLSTNILDEIEPYFNAYFI